MLIKYMYMGKHKTASHKLDLGDIYIYVMYILQNLMCIYIYIYIYIYKYTCIYTQCVYI